MLFFLVYFPGRQKNRKSKGALPIYLFFSIAINYFQGQSQNRKSNSALVQLFFFEANYYYWLPAWGQGPLSVADFEQFASGSRCHTDGNIGVLVAAPFARSMHEDLRRQLFANLLSLECANTGFNLYFALCVLR